MLGFIIKAFKESRDKDRKTRIERMISMLPALSDRELLEWFYLSEGEMNYDRNDMNLNREIAKEIDSRGLVV